MHAARERLKMCTLATSSSSSVDMAPPLSRARCLLRAPLWVSLIIENQLLHSGIGDVLHLFCVYGPSAPKFPLFFRPAFRYTFLGVGEVVPKSESTEERPVSRRVLLWKAIILCLRFSDISKKPEDLVFFFPGACFSEHNSETGFEQISEFPRWFFFSISI